MKIIKTELPEILILEYELRKDVRGPKHPVYSESELKEAGIDFHMVAENIYYPEKRGTLYGIHFQNNPKPQAKIMSCTKGGGIDYSVDLRKDSPNYLKWVAIELDDKANRQIYVPEGFGHVFLATEDDTIVHMKFNADFDDSLCRQIAWNDPQIGIQYPIDNPILAPHDMVAPLLKDCDICL